MNKTVRKGQFSKLLNDDENIFYRTPWDLSKCNEAEEMIQIVTPKPKENLLIILFLNWPIKKIKVIAFLLSLEGLNRPEVKLPKKGKPKVY